MAAHVVLLGNTGFVGRRLEARLRAEGHEVRGYATATLDLRDPASLRALEGAATPESVLVVLAALTPDRGATLDTFTGNVQIAVNVARFLEEHSARRCVLFSSDAVYSFDTNPVDEGTPVDPQGLYAVAKHTAEGVLTAVAQRRGIPLLRLRPTAVYGPGDTHNSYGPNRFVRQAVRERVVRLFGQGEETRDHLYVDDLAAVAAALAVSDTVGTVNLATGESRSFASVVEDLRAIVPHPFEVVCAPRQSPITHRRFDIAQLRQALPDLRLTPFAEGLRATVAAETQ